MLAVFVNCVAVVLGSLLGLLVAGRMSRKMEDVIQTGAGFITLILGMQMAFKYQNVCFLTLAIILGGIIGTIIDLDAKILSLGKLLARLVPQKNSGSCPEKELYQLYFLYCSLQ